MRLVLTSFFGLLWVAVTAQSPSDAIHYQREGASIQQVLNDLEVEYGIRFSYATSSWTTKKMDVDFDGDSIEEILDYLLGDEDLEYKIISNNILLRKSTDFITNETEAYKESLHLKGKISTASNPKEGLSYAIIAIEGTSVGTYSNEDGTFDLEIPKEHLDQNLTIKYVGYKDVRYKISELEDAYIFLPMSEETIAIEQVTIVNQEKSVRINSYQNKVTLSTSSTINQTSGLMAGDLNRSIQLLSGISAFNDDDADILIRGSNSDQTLSIIDGMPLYTKGHYYGIFSSVNGRYIKEVNVYKNTYPIEYNGGVSGMVEYKSRNANIDTTQARLEVDLLTIGGSVEIPLSKNIGLKIGGRSTLKPVSNNQFNTVSESQSTIQNTELFGGRLKGERSQPEFDFYDVNIGLQWLGKDNNRLAINAYRSADQLINKYQFTIDDAKKNRVALDAKEDQNWNTTAASIDWSQNLGKKNFTLNTKAYYSDYNSIETNTITLDKKINSGNGGPNINNPNGVLLSVLNENFLTDKGADLSLRYKNTMYSLVFGLSTKQQDVKYGFLENKQLNFGGKRSVVSFAGYGEYGFSTERLGIILGLRSTYYDNLSKTLFSPRAILSYTFNDHLILKSSYSIHQQVIRQFYYEYRGVPKELWVAANDRLIPLINSQNLMIGATILKGMFTLDLEVFQKYQNGLTEYAVLNPDDASNNPDRARDYRLFRGDGYIRGLDVTMNTAYKSFSTQIAYTLSWSDERYRAINRNTYFPSENDRRHQVKWANSYQLNRWIFGANFIYASGRPYTDIGNLGTLGDIRNTDPAKWLKRLPDYNRIDVRLGYEFNLFGLDATMNGSVFNLLNTQNVKYVQTVVTELEADQNAVNTILGNDSALLNQTLNLGLEVRF